MRPVASNQQSQVLIADGRDIEHRDGVTQPIHWSLWISSRHCHVKSELMHDVGEYFDGELPGIFIGLEIWISQELERSDRWSRWLSLARFLTIPAAAPSTRPASTAIATATCGRRRLPRTRTRPVIGLDFVLTLSGFGRFLFCRLNDGSPTSSASTSTRTAGCDAPVRSADQVRSR